MCSSYWDYARPKVVSCGCCAGGLLLCLAAALLYGNRTGQEVAVWYK